MGLCLIYEVTLTDSLLITHKINYIIFRSSSEKGCSLSAALATGWSRLVGSEGAPSPLFHDENQTSFSRPGSDERELFKRRNGRSPADVSFSGEMGCQQAKWLFLKTAMTTTQFNPKMPKVEDEECRASCRKSGNAPVSQFSRNIYLLNQFLICTYPRLDSICSHLYWKHTRKGSFKWPGRLNKAKNNKFSVHMSTILF